jgi:hypothetical protein
MFFYFAFTAFCDFRKAKNRPKNVSKRHIFPILGTPKTEGGIMLLETLMSDPEGRRLGARLTIEL